MSLNGKMMFSFAILMSLFLGMNIARLWEQVSPTHINPWVLGLMIISCGSLLAVVGAAMMRRPERAVSAGIGVPAMVVTRAPDLNETLRVDHNCPECKGQAITLANIMQSFNSGDGKASGVDCAGCGVHLVFVETGPRTAALRVPGKER